MTKMETEAKTSGASSWNADHVRRYRGTDSRLWGELGNQRKVLAKRY